MNTFIVIRAIRQGSDISARVAVLRKRPPERRGVLVLLDTSEALDTCAGELGCEVEQLLTPLTRFKRQRPDARFAIDNGAYAGFKADAFLALLEREKDAQTQCIFLAVPDVVGSARRTLEVFDHWASRLRGWPLALVAQDGQEHLPIPWDSIKAVFIGGSTEFKLSKEVEQIVRAAQALGKWVHAGRVNTPGRFERFEQLGVDSIDGTGLSRFSWMRERIYRRDHQGELLATSA